MLTCRELFDFLHDYLEGELTLKQRMSLRVHLAMCKHCREYVETYKRTIDVAKQACEGDEPIPDDVPEDLVRAILEARRTK